MLTLNMLAVRAAASRFHREFSLSALSEEMACRAGLNVRGNQVAVCIHVVVALDATEFIDDKVSQHRIEIALDVAADVRTPGADLKDVIAHDLRSHVLSLMAVLDWGGGDEDNHRAFALGLAFRRRQR